METRADPNGLDGGRGLHALQVQSRGCLPVSAELLCTRGGRGQIPGASPASLARAAAAPTWTWNQCLSC